MAFNNKNTSKMKIKNENKNKKALTPKISNLSKIKKKIPKRIPNRANKIIIKCQTRIRKIDFPNLNNNKKQILIKEEDRLLNREIGLLHRIEAQNSATNSITPEIRILIPKIIKVDMRTVSIRKSKKKSLYNKEEVVILKCIKNNYSKQKETL